MYVSVRERERESKLIESGEDEDDKMAAGGSSWVLAADADRANIVNVLSISLSERFALLLLLLR